MASSSIVKSRVGFRGFFFGGRPRFRLGVFSGSFVSAGSKPISTDMTNAFGILSQVRPEGLIHLRRLRF